MNKLVKELKEKHKKGESGFDLLLSAYENSFYPRGHEKVVLKDESSVIHVTVMMGCES